MTDPQKLLVDFVSGAVPASEFEQLVYNDGPLEAFLSAAPAPQHFHGGTNLHHYLLGLDYADPGAMLDAHGAVRDLLLQQGVTFTPSDSPRQTYDLILAAQPSWLSVSSKYAANLLAAAPPLKGSALKAWLRARLIEQFKHCGRPPRWLQTPDWPIGPNGPLIFFGQISVPNYFHDEASVYVFHDPATGECTCITQVA